MKSLVWLISTNLEREREREREYEYKLFFYQIIDKLFMKEMYSELLMSCNTSIHSMEIF